MSERWKRREQPILPLEPDFAWLTFNFDSLFSKPEHEAISSLAWIGDAIYELYLRTSLLASSDSKSGRLHTMGTRFAKAAWQSLVYSRLESVLTEEEQHILTRGRNTQTFSQAKNASSRDYRRATAVEALFGYVYLKGKSERLALFMKIALAQPTDEERKYLREQSELQKKKRLKQNERNKD